MFGDLREKDDGERLEYNDIIEETAPQPSRHRKKILILSFSPCRQKRYPT